MKKIQDLGKTLSRNEQKKIRGGTDPVSICKIGYECTYYESGTGNVTGMCKENSNGRCVCDATTSSVIWSACGWEA